MAGAIQHDHDEVLDVAVQTLGDGTQVVRGRGVQIDGAFARRPDDDFLHVQVGSVKQAALFAGGQDGNRAGSAGGAKVGAFQGIDGNIDGGEIATADMLCGADFFTDEEHGGFVSFALATPRYFSYFNVAAGGPRGGTKHLVDSNVDWGQDLIRLKRWMTAHGVAEVDLAYFGTADPRAYEIAFRKVALFIDFYPELPVARPESGRYLAASVTLLAGIYMDADRVFANELLRRGFASRSTIDEYLGDSESRAAHGDPLVHIADWMTERGLITSDQRLAAEDGIPATWLRNARDKLTPIGWAGDSIAIYRIP